MTIQRYWRNEFGVVICVFSKGASVYNFDIESNLFFSFADYGLVWVFTQFDVASYVKPFMVLIVFTEKDFVVVDNEDVYDKVYFFVNVGHG